MGIFDRFRRTTPQPVTTADYYGAWSLSDTFRAQVLKMSVEELWRSQPYLRTVVTFMARNIAHLGLHVFQRLDEADRVRVQDGGMAGALRRPNTATTTYELVYALVADLALYDTAYWLISDDPANPIVRLPVAWVHPVGGDALGPESYMVHSDARGHSVRIPADQILKFHGWHPGSLQVGATPVDALKSILAEQLQAAHYREQVWKRGGRVSSVIKRPKDAPEWSDAARERFREDWNSRYAGDGDRAGGTPILGDGMELQRMDFNAHEQEFVEGSKLALTTVASVYHLNPTMIGLLDNANYSNVREFRKMLYGDSLGPVIAQIEARINAFLVGRFDPRPDVYVEFNIAEKLQGSFEEQAAVMSTLVGAPVMTRDEGRGRFNLPAIGGDAEQLVTPLNVLVGGQASPRDSGSQNLAAGRTDGRKSIEFKARAPQTHEQKHAEVLRKFFRRQADVVKSRLGAKADEDWWDGERWDNELSADLFGLAVVTSTAVAAEVVDSLGFSEDDYDVERTHAYLTAMTTRIAQAMNAATKDQLDAALASDDPAAAVSHVFEIAETSRTDQAATTTVTALSGFASMEATKQTVGDRGTKTWVATSQNPRKSHAAVNGETVALSENFSNGLAWPGDGGNADEVAGCTCQLQMNVAR